MISRGSSGPDPHGFLGKAADPSQESQRWGSQAFAKTSCDVSPTWLMTGLDTGRCAETPWRSNGLQPSRRRCVTNGFWELMGLVAAAVADDVDVVIAVVSN